jgi:Kef-type K+ transport system membrane component KefB
VGAVLTASGAIAAALLLARAGGWLARRCGQPSVLGEVLVGLLAVPALTAAGARGTVDTITGPAVLGPLTLVGHAGLVLFLVAVVYELVGPRAVGSLGGGPGGSAARVVTSVALGAAAVPCLGGLALGAVLLHSGRPDLRGDATPAAVLFLLAAATAVTAVPVLARLLDERGLLRTEIGGLAMSAAVVIDSVAWLLLAVALAVAAAAAGSAVRVGVALVVLVGAAAVVRRLLRSSAVNRLAMPARWLLPVLVGVSAYGAARGLRSAGVSEVLAAALLGAVLPQDGARDPTGDGVDGPWHRAVGAVGRIGRWLVPVFFVAVGADAFGPGTRWPPGWLILLCLLVATGAKALGAVAGARLAGLPAHAGLRLAVLLNCRGLTELVVLQAGREAGILTGAAYLAMLVMALVTTAATWPVYSAVDRRLPGGVLAGR